MIDAWIPISIFGLPLLGLLALSAIYEGGTSASEGSAELDLIAQLSGPVSPGAISRLSGPVSPGAISTLSGWRSPGAISKLSGHVSPGAISRLSGHKSPGAISRLSAPRPVGAISKLSAGFFVSTVFGLPLLTRSQGPLEPDDSLLISDRTGARERPTPQRNLDRSSPPRGGYGVGK
jgi:hypothetical protein